MVLWRLVIIICTLCLQENIDFMMMGRTGLKQFTGKETTEITVPLHKIQDDYLFHTDSNWQVAFICYSGHINNHYPKDPLLRYF